MQVVVESIRRNIRSSDALARLGGDEFAILFPETGAEAASVMVRKVRNKMSEKMQEKGWPVTASTGLLTCMKPPQSDDELVQKLTKSCTR